MVENQHKCSEINRLITSCHLPHHTPHPTRRLHHPTCSITRCDFVISEPHPLRLLFVIIITKTRHEKVVQGFFCRCLHICYGCYNVFLSST